jgi:hypothetical protein
MNEESKKMKWSRIEDIKFPWEYTAEELKAMPESISEHGRCIDYRQEAYCDVHVFEDGHEERIYICD